MNIWLNTAQVSEILECSLPTARKIMSGMDVKLVDGVNSVSIYEMVRHLEERQREVTGMYQRCADVTNMSSIAELKSATIGDYLGHPYSRV